jgi:hypothetical protein
MDLKGYVWIEIKQIQETGWSQSHRDADPAHVVNRQRLSNPEPTN